MRSVTIYMSTSTLENAIEILLNAGYCFRKREEAVDYAARHLEHVFPIQVTEEFHPALTPRLSGLEDRYFLSGPHEGGKKE